MKYCWGDLLKGNEMDGVCGTCGGEGKCIRGIGGKTWKKENLEDVVLDDNLILKRNLKK
jgi:hypothetical protein